MSIERVRIQSVVLAPHLMMVVPDMNLPEFAIQLWPGVVLIFQRSYVHGASTNHFVATEIASGNSIRPCMPVLVKGVLLPNTGDGSAFEEAIFCPNEGKSMVAA